MARRTTFLAALLFLAPLLTYWPATFHDYGLRDDYSNLREAHEEPGKIMRFCASHARPIYGWLLQKSYGATTSVQNLQWMRFAAALLLGAVALACFRGFRNLGWSRNASLCFAFLLVLIPSSQVIASWAVGWPYAVTALLAIAGFFTADSALTSQREHFGRSVRQLSAALLVMVVSALIYQPSALFYAVPLAAALIVRRHKTLLQSGRWLALHLGVVTLSLALAYGVMSVLYATGVFVKSNRVAFEHHWGDKLIWFLSETMPNALSLFVLNDNNDRHQSLFFACAAVVGVLLLAGAFLEWRRHGHGRGIIWLCGLFGLPTFACAVSLLASERYATYRTIFAMTAVLLCFLVASVTALTSTWSSTTRRVLAGCVLALAFVTAQHHAYALIAVPQGNEWQLLVEGARKTHLDGERPNIFAVAPAPADISTSSIYHDEFGSLSSNSEWVPREMFKRAMHDLHPGISHIDSRYHFATGPAKPQDQDFDVVIDLHDLKKYWLDN